MHSRTFTLLSHAFEFHGLSHLKCKAQMAGHLSLLIAPLQPLQVASRLALQPQLHTMANVLQACENIMAAPSPKKPRLEPAEVPLFVKKLSEHATIPQRGSAGAAGYDLSSAYDYTVPARGKELVKTDLAIKLPHGTYGRVAPRSGLAVKHSITTGAGVIDEDYRGNIGVVLFNLSDTDFPIKKGDRIAQLILERIMTPPVQEVEELDDTNRGEGGFGSTGVAAQ